MDYKMLKKYNMKKMTCPEHGFATFLMVAGIGIIGFGVVLALWLMIDGGLWAAGVALAVPGVLLLAFAQILNELHTIVFLLWPKEEPEQKAETDDQ